ncbi:MAG: leucine-rich repeat protein [Atribacterota bacterium]
MLKKRNLIFLSFLILGTLLLTSCFLKPPVTEGILKGQVIVPEGSKQTKDLTGQALPDATVNIIDPATGDIIATTTTDADGYYQVFVPAGGPYILESVKDGVKLQQFTPQVEVGIEYDLGTADCSTTSVALIAQAMMDAEDYPDNPADINLTAIEADSNFNDVMSIVCSSIEAGGDPTVSALVQQAVEDLLHPPTPAPTPPAAISVSAVSVTPTTMTLIAGGAAGTVTKTITPANATNQNVNWSSSDTGIATVASGVVTPVAAGTATITVTTVDGSYTANCAVTVTTPEGYFTFDISTKTITNYDVAGGLNVVIPSTISGFAVEHIGGAFANKYLTSVTIPNSVITIANHAFAFNELISVTIGNSVTSIGDSAFTYNDLTSVTIPNSVTSIGNYAFANNLLTTVTIPNSMTTIGASAFFNNLLTSITIPNFVTSIGDSAFYGNLLTTVTIPNSMTTIGVAVFSHNLLTSVTIPDSVTSIGGDAFANNLLTSITIPNFVTSIGNYAFVNNLLTTVTIPNSVNTIGDSAFAGNHLTSVTIGAGVDINVSLNTMGTNTGFKTVYDVGGKLAGTYNYGVEWVKALLAIGDSYGGGIVAYILQTGDPGYDANVQHGLIAATADYGGDRPWSNVTSTLLGTTGTAIGTGQANTTAIMGQPGHTTGAAWVCDFYSVTVDSVLYDDWFLPSKDELDKLYDSKSEIGGFADDWYWSSSEYDAGFAWRQNFSDSTSQDHWYKGDTYKVRPVRVF